MSRILQLLLLLLATGGLARGAGPPVYDDAGRLLQLSGPPQRIVSLSPGATAMLYAAGGGDRVVGTADFSVEPAAARRIPRIGDSHGFDLERILALRPDLVIAWMDGVSEAQLLPFERAGLPVYRHRVRRLDDLPAALQRLGELLNTRPVAQRSAAALSLRITALRARYRRDDAPRLLLQVWDRPVYTLGGAQLISDVIEACGYRNIYGELRAAAPAVSLESIAARDPDVILALATDEAVARAWLEQWRALPALRAVRQGRLLSFADARLSRMGPEVLPAAEDLCARLRALP